MWMMRIIQRALADIYAQRLAGLFIIYSNNLLATPLFTHPGLARVTMGNPHNAGFPVFAIRWNNSIHGRLDYLAARGRRRMAI